MDELVKKIDERERNKKELKKLYKSKKISNTDMIEACLKYATENDFNVNVDVIKLHDETSAVKASFDKKLYSKEDVRNLDETKISDIRYWYLVSDKWLQRFVEEKLILLEPFGGLLDHM